MFSEAAIYERTVKGYDEIQDKTHALTQGERLILVLVDGITPYRCLGQKLNGLAEGRLNRALRSLLGRGLIIVVDVSPPSPPTEKLESHLIDRFLQQDPLDPVTVTLLEQVDGGFVVAGVGHGSRDACSLPVIDVSERRRIAAVDFYLPLERMANPDVTGLRVNARVEGLLHMASSRDKGRRSGDSAGRRRREAQSRRVQLGCWLLFIGLIAAMLSVIVQSS